MGEDGQKTQTSSYNFWGCYVEHGNYSQQYCIVYLKVVKRMDLQSSHNKKKIVIM